MLEFDSNNVEFEMWKVSTKSDKPLRNYLVGALSAPTCEYQRPKACAE